MARSGWACSAARPDPGSRSSRTRCSNSGVRAAQACGEHAVGWTPECALPAGRSRRTLGSRHRSTGRPPSSARRAVRRACRARCRSRATGRVRRQGRRRPLLAVQSQCVKALVVEPELTIKPVSQGVRIGVQPLAQCGVVSAQATHRRNHASTSTTSPWATPTSSDGATPRSGSGPNTSATSRSSTATPSPKRNGSSAGAVAASSTAPAATGACMASTAVETVRAKINLSAHRGVLVCDRGSTRTNPPPAARRTRRTRAPHPLR
jgi:hypothetical protein